MNKKLFSISAKNKFIKIYSLFLLIYFSPLFLMAQSGAPSINNDWYENVTTDVDKTLESIFNFDNSAVTTINFDNNYSSSVSEHQIDVSNPTTLIPKLYGGESIVLMRTGNATAGPSVGHSRAEAAINATKDFSIEANNNTLNVLNNSGFTGKTYGGRVNVSFLTGNVFANDVQNIGAGGYTIKNNSINLYGKINLSASGNKNIIAMNSEVLDLAIGGDVTLQAITGTAKYGEIINNPTTVNNENRGSTYTNIFASNAILDASGNSVDLKGNATEVFGGRAVIDLSSGDGQSGDVNIISATVDSKTTDAYTNSYVVAENLIVKANSNSVQTDGASTNIYGGSSDLILASGNATAGNSTNLHGNSINVDVNANALIRATGSTIEAIGNKVVSTGMLTDIIGGNAVVSMMSGDAKAGIIRSNSTVYNDSKKAYAYSEIFGNNMVIRSNGNDVEVGADGTVTNITGGNSQLIVSGGKATSGMVITSGHEANPVANIDAGANIDLTNTLLEANNNEVKLLGSLNDSGNIIGGDIHYMITQGEAYTATGALPGRNKVLTDGTKAFAMNNTIELGESAKVVNGGLLYGGRLTHNGTYLPNEYDLFTGNTLNTSAKQLLNFKEVANFQYYNFTLTPALVNSNSAIISADSIIFGSNTQNQSTNSHSSSEISVVGMHSGDTILSIGDQFVLMQANPGQLQGNAITGKERVTQIQQGISLVYDVETKVEHDKDRVVTTILSVPKTNRKSISLGDGRLAMEALLLRGADNLVGIIDQKHVEGYVPFVDFYAGHSKYSNGSTIRANEYLITMGMAHKKDNWVIAPIIEYGWSDYKNQTQYETHLTSNGSGDNYYYGLGILSRYDFNNGLYLDGSIRYGRARNKFESKDLINIASGEVAKYKISSPYLGAHLSLGYLMTLNDRSELDISSTFLWTKLKGKEVRVAGDLINFGAINSKRLNVGIQWNYMYDTKTIFRAGVAYEYEFDTDYKVKTYRIFDIDTTSLKGSTGIIHLGTTMKSSHNSRLTYDANITGYFGKRKGGEFSIRANYDL